MNCICWISCSGGHSSNNKFSRWLNNSNQDSNELFYPTPVNTMPPIFTREREAEEESSPSPEQKEIKEIAEDPVSDLTNPVDKDTKPSLRTRSDEIQDRPVEEKGMASLASVICRIEGGINRTQEPSQDHSHRGTTHRLLQPRLVRELPVPDERHL